MRGCGRIERPAFPAPSEFQGQERQNKTRAHTRGEIAKLWLHTAGCLTGELGSNSF
jgi:sarcosine oxidase delta subunit